MILLGGADRNKHSDLLVDLENDHMKNVNIYTTSFIDAFALLLKCEPKNAKTNSGLNLA